jgi:uncharacterized protein (DUF1330 family)
MTAYAVAHLYRVDVGPEIVEYLERIDDTFVPFDGRFVIHGAAPESREGDWEGALIVIEFPDLERARAWYDSPAYQAILPLRTRHATGWAIIVDGVEPGHRGIDALTGSTSASS